MVKIQNDKIGSPSHPDIGPLCQRSLRDVSMPFMRIPSLLLLCCIYPISDPATAHKKEPFIEIEKRTDEPTRALKRTSLITCRNGNHPTKSVDRPTSRPWGLAGMRRFRNFNMCAIYIQECSTWLRVLFPYIITKWCLSIFKKVLKSFQSRPKKRADRRGERMGEEAIDTTPRELNWVNSRRLNVSFSTEVKTLTSPNWIRIDGCRRLIRSSAGAWRARQMRIYLCPSWITALLCKSRQCLGDTYYLGGAGKNKKTKYGDKTRTDVEGPSEFSRFSGCAAARVIFRPPPRNCSSLLMWRVCGSRPWPR